MVEMSLCGEHGKETHGETEIGGKAHHSLVSIVHFSYIVHVYCNELRLDTIYCPFYVRNTVKLG